MKQERSNRGDGEADAKARHDGPAPGPACAREAQTRRW
jgi:hypothetical protein